MTQRCTNESSVNSSICELHCNPTAANNQIVHRTQIVTLLIVARRISNEIDGVIDGTVRSRRYKLTNSRQTNDVGAARTSYFRWLRENSPRDVSYTASDVRALGKAFFLSREPPANSVVRTVAMEENSSDRYYRWSSANFDSRDRIIHRTNRVWEIGSCGVCRERNFEDINVSANLDL